MSKSSRIIVHSQLNHYFFQKLQELNMQIPCPVNQEILFYSSELLHKYAMAEKLFRVSPYHALSLMESSTADMDEQKNTLKDIAETSLLRCGYFSQSRHGLLDIHHYQKMGVHAYEKLHSFTPEFLGIRSFYLVMATSFPQVCEMMQVLASRDQSDPDSYLLAKAS